MNKSMKLKTYIWSSRYIGKFILFLGFCNGVTLSFACISVSEKLFLVASGFICFKVVILVEGFICQ